MDVANAAEPNSAHCLPCPRLGDSTSPRVLPPSSFHLADACIRHFFVTLDFVRVTHDNPPQFCQQPTLELQDENMKKSDASQDLPASTLISNRIAELGDWRGEALRRMRKLINEADRDVVEEWKWGLPVWSHDGIICTGESYKSAVKLTFAKGASLKDPARLFNSSLDGNVRRAIDIHEGEEVDGSAFKTLVRQAVALNSAGKSKARTRREQDARDRRG